MPQMQLQIRDEMRASVRQFPRHQPIIFRVAMTADGVPAWWGKDRDAYLRLFWQQESFLASTVYALCARNAGFQWVVEGPEAESLQATRTLRNVEFGQGWQQLMLQFSEDLLVSDNGGFIEIIRPARARINGKSYPAIAKRHKSGDIDWFAIISRMGHVKQVEPEDVSDSPYDLPVSLAHLDSAKVTRTGDPDTPVIYTDRNGGEHELKSWQVMSMTDMPSPIEEMHGVGFCFVSRVLRNAQTVRDWTIFRQEKISGRFARAVHLTNVDSDWISDAIAQAQAKADERGLLVYSQPIITNTLDPSSRPYLVTIPLAELPDGFTEDETMRWYIGLLALAAGEHYSFLAPMPGRRLGSAREVEVQERQARGKSSRLFMDQLATQINNAGILPEGCVFVFREKDTEEQAAHEQAERRRAETRKMRIESGEITPAIARQIAKDQGDLKDEYLQQLGEEDITPDEGEPLESVDGVEEKQEEPLDISKDDVARAIGKWNDRMSEAEGLLQASEAEKTAGGLDAE